MSFHILNIETSTGVCSVSISSGNNIKAYRESREGKSHSSLLTVFIDEVMKEAGLGFNELSAVSISRGPGSYTGLRIGVSAAKGICYATGLPLIAVNTLALMAEMAKGIDHVADWNNIILCPMIDARRMEVYMALFDLDGNQKTDISAEIIDENSFNDLPAGTKLLYFGDGAEKCREVLAGSQSEFVPGIYPSAALMATHSAVAWAEGRFEDTAYFTPFYLKDFIATTPRKWAFNN